MSGQADRELERARAAKLLRDNLALYARECLHIRTKEMQVAPFRFNASQLYLHQKLEEQKRRTGKVRMLVLKGRQVGMCLDPSTRVLTADLRWVPIAQLSPGQEVVATDEAVSGGRGAARKMRTATIEAVARVVQDAYRITFDDGRHVDCSGSHRWLSRKSQTQAEWRAIESKTRAKLAVGDHIRWVTKPWGEPTYMDGWFGGALDGEGSFENRNCGQRVTFTQRLGSVLDQAISYCQWRGYTFQIQDDRKPERPNKFGRDPCPKIVISRADEIFRLFGQTRPVRFIAKRFWEGKDLPGKKSGIGWARIVSVEPLGKRQLVDLQTSCKTFIAEGFVSHNSTYIAARFYHKTTHTRGARSFILTHEDRATDNLFDIVHRFHERCPPEVRPNTGAASAKELSFDILDSGYKVGTAGSKSVGRSDTIQLFHGSEMAFWPNAEVHSAGIGEAIANVPGTEDIRESTANGIGGSFHTLWKKAEAGDTEFECCFIPWFMHEEYSTEPPKGWNPPQSFADYAGIYNLTPAQTYWAWLKNREKAATAGGSSDEFNWQFRQEYPANADEAFQTSGANHFIKPEVVLKARKAKITGIGPIVLGVDPARGGNDKMGIIDRQRRRLGGHVCERYTTSRDQRANAGHIVQIWKRLKQQGLPVKKICIDSTDGGALADYVEDALGDDVVVRVNFGERAHQPEHYANRRAEMSDELRKWFDDASGVQIPDLDHLQGDLCCFQWGAGLTHYRPNGQLVMTPKEKIREEYGFSPDLFDAAILTHAVDYSELQDAPTAESGGNLGSAGWLV